MATVSFEEDSVNQGMRAAVFTEYGGPFKIAKIVAPSKAGESDIIVAVRSTSINPADWKVRNGSAKIFTGKHFPKLTGHDFSGVITQIGSKVTQFQVGDEVFGATGFSVGSCAEYVKSPAYIVAKKPKNQDWNEAASIPVVGLTAYEAIFNLSKLSSGQKILILGAGSAVGMFAVQFAKIVNATVWVTCSAEKSHFIKSLGADVIIDYKNEDIIKAIGLEKMDVVFDAIGSKVDREKSFFIVKRNGIVVTSNPTDYHLKELSFTMLIKVMTDVIWKKASNYSTNRVSYMMISLDERQYGSTLEKIARFIEEGKLKAVIDSVFPFEQIQEASIKNERGEVRGKVVVEISK